MMMVVDVSRSMVLEPLAAASSAGKLEAAQAAAHRFIDNLNLLARPGRRRGVPRRRRSIDSRRSPPTRRTRRRSSTAASQAGIFCATNICPGDGSNLDRRARHRARRARERRATAPDATKVVVYIGDGGIDADVDPTAADRAPARVGRARGGDRASAPRIDGAVVRQIASSPNDYFYAPSGPGIDFAFNNLNQDVCRNLRAVRQRRRRPGRLQRPHPEHADAAGRGPRRRRPTATRA